MNKKSKKTASISKRKGRKVSSGEVTSTTPAEKPSNNPEAYELFLKTIKRANNLIALHNQDERLDEKHLDAFRASVVLAISALDAYVRTLVISKILKILTQKETSISSELSEYIKNLMNYDTLFEAARKYQFNEKVEKAIRADFETKSLQGEYKINVYMNLAGYKDIFESVSQSMNQSKVLLQGQLGGYTKRRHLIAHCGDYDFNLLPHVENKMEKSYAQNCIKIVSEFAEHVNKIVGNA